MSETQPSSEITQYPLLPLRDVVVFPHMVIPLFVGRPKSIKAMETAMEAGKSILLVAQRSAAKDDPGPEDMYAIGCVSNILQMLKLPDGTVKVLVEGGTRAQIREIADVRTHWVAEASPIPPDGAPAAEAEAMRRALLSAFDQYVKLNKKIPPEILTSLSGIDEAGRLADTVAAHLPLKLEQKQQVLEMFEVKQRLEHLLSQLETEIDILQVEKRIRGRVKRQMEKSKREYYLNEQVKAIQKELGEGEEGADLEEMEKRIKRAHMPKDARKKAEAELKKLKLMSPMSAEATVVRNYIDTIVNLPWKKKSKISKDIKLAQEILDKDHYGLEKVKERIVEYLAVQTRVDKMKAPILCLVGAPGVGKTSLGQSIAKSTNRKFVRMSLGGVRDEAEIRGHRRTYIGALPGRIVQGLRRAERRDPVFMLDEIDKIGADWRGDPSSALLEVLDPAQNDTFVDTYLGVPFDRTQVLFIATCNTLDTIPGPLRDRMEVLTLSGYTDEEKVGIATQYLVPKQLSAHGLRAGELVVEPDAIRVLVRRYTREAGVRNLERELAAVARKVARRLAEGQAGPFRVTAENLDDYLGRPRFFDEVVERTSRPGVATGLAWTPVGGDVLFVEVTMMPSSEERLVLTGMLGDIMRESAQAAVSYVWSSAETFGIAPKLFEGKTVHIHVPAGAIPKDGPSAGVTMVTALASYATRRAVRSDVAMTGEITLRGKVLPVGGIKEKVLAAHRVGIRTVILPRHNERDLEDVAAEVRGALQFVFVDDVGEVVRQALSDAPPRAAG